MLYKRISNALCLAICLSMTTTHSSTETRNISDFLRLAKDTVLGYTDSAAGKLGFTNTASLAKVTVFLLIIIPLIKYLTDGKQFDKASSDEELAKALKTFKGKKSLRSLKSLSSELLYKVIRMIRSKLGYRSYLITIKEEKTTNEDGSKTNVLELKTVGATGLCRYVEDMGEHMVFVINSAMGLSGIQKLAKFLNNNKFVEAETINYKLVSNH